MKKFSVIAVLSMTLWTVSGASLAVDMRPTGNDLHLRVVSLETTVAVLHHDISSLREVLVKQRITGIDAPPQRVEAQATPVMNDCRPPVNRCVQRRGAQK